MVAFEKNTIPQMSAFWCGAAARSQHRFPAPSFKRKDVVNQWLEFGAAEADLKKKNKKKKRKKKKKIDR